jgi:hypothetical protein
MDFCLGVFPHCFPRRIELPIDKNTAYLSRFPSVRNINFVKCSSFQVHRRCTVSNQCKKQEGLTYCFHVTIGLTFERNTANLTEFLTVRKITFVQNNSFQVDERNTISLVRNPSMFKAEGSITFFPCEN